MSSDVTETVHVPLSQRTIRELRTKAMELRELAATARTDWEIDALGTLGARYDALAECRAIEEEVAYRAAEALTRRITADPPLHIAQNVAPFATPAKPYPPCPDTTMGQPFPEAWRMACERLSRRYVDPETLNHPLVVSECYNLACMLMAYGLVPTKPVTQDSCPAGQSRDGTSPADKTTHHILVVDDVHDILVTVGAFLAKAGFPIRNASTGDEALRLIADDPRIDVLVTDYAMPGLSGGELIVLAAQIRPNLKSLIITGYPNADGLLELPPGTIVLVKPFRRHALIAGINSLLGEVPMISHETIEAVELVRQPGI